MMITVFTPTYNRAYIINRLYDSLKKQTFKDFEWLVIDDGSTDDTNKYFNSIDASDHFFRIRYLKIENGGKHRAINKALDLAEGELFFIVDSDDFLPNDSLANIYEVYSHLDNKAEFCGVCGQKGDVSGFAIGSTFDGEMLDTTYLERKNYNIQGDKSEVFITDVLKKYRFPEFEDEKFIPESVVWNKIAADGYKFRYFNKVVYCCEYLPDGLTMQGNEKYKSIPKGWGLYVHQSIEFGKIKKLKKWETVFDYYRMFNDILSMREMANNLHFNFLVFVLRIDGMRLFYKLYNR